MSDETGMVNHEAHGKPDVTSAVDGLGACYDRSQTAAQDVQDAAEVSIASSTGLPVGARSFKLSEALDVKAGDVVNFRLVTNKAGQLVVSELEVTRRGD